MADPVEIATSDELLWRNVHPGWVDKGRLTSQVFRPTPKDQQRLSVARSSVVNASDHYVEYTDTIGLDSAGVWAASVEECVSAGVSAFHDEHSSMRPNPCPAGHAHLDFTPHTKGQARRIGGALRDRAEARGRLHP